VTLRGLQSLLFARRERRAEDHRREQILTLATVLTTLRGCVTSAIFVIAIVSRSHSDLLIALAISMFLDFFDGIAARLRDRETILGAQMDGLADRLAAFFVVVAVVSMRGQAYTVIVAAAVWFQFGVVDQFLSAQFLRFGLWSPDHVYAVDEKTWSLNWSPQAKFASNLPIALLAIGGWCIWPALALSVSLVILRLYAYGAIRVQAVKRIPELHLTCPNPPPITIASPPTYPTDREPQLRITRVTRREQRQQVTSRH
jgi:CDP-diacylglycerol--glycerol-3-phosphate 3-phosphatidyltransferase